MAPGGPGGPQGSPFPPLPPPSFWFFYLLPLSFPPLPSSPVSSLVPPTYPQSHCPRNHLEGQGGLATLFGVRTPSHLSPPVAHQVLVILTPHLGFSTPQISHFPAPLRYSPVWHCRALSWGCMLASVTLGTRPFPHGSSCKQLEGGDLAGFTLGIPGGGWYTVVLSKCLFH